MKFRSLLATAAFAGSLGLASAALADTVVYNGGAPDQMGQIYGQLPAGDAMNFTLAAGQNVITDAHWWGGCYAAGGGTGCDDTTAFIVLLLSDNGGLPGSIVDLLAFDSNANQTATGKDFTPPSGETWAEYAYSISFPAITLTAGTQYWLALTQVGDQSQGTWGIETTSSASPGQLGATIGIFDPLNWTIMSEQYAFQLTGPGAGTVPEASTWAMMLAGFAGLGWLGVSRRRAGRAAVA